MPAAYEFINDSGTVSIRVNGREMLGPFSTRPEAMKALMRIILENIEKIDDAFQIALEERPLGRRHTILPPAA